MGISLGKLKSKIHTENQPKEKNEGKIFFTEDVKYHSNELT